MSHSPLKLGMGVSCWRSLIAGDKVEEKTGGVVGVVVVVVVVEVVVVVVVDMVEME